MSSIEAMLFDLDGTLLDSAPDLVSSLNHVRSSHDLGPHAVNKFRHFVSQGAVGLLKAGMPDTDDETFERWRLTFLAHYAENSFRESRLFDGVWELLEFLGKAEIPWGVVTNKIELYTHPIMSAAGLEALASCVVCGDTLSRSKPDPAPVLFACELINVDPRQVLFVGDDIRDLEAGKSAGTQIAAVHYGYGIYDDNNPLVAESFQIYHPSDLVRLVADG